MTEGPTQTEPYSLFILFYLSSVFIIIVLLLFAALVALEQNINYFVALLLVVGGFSVLTAVSWWVTGKKWVVKVLNTITGTDFFTVRKPSSKSRHSSSLSYSSEEEGE